MVVQSWWLSVAGFLQTAAESLLACPVELLAPHRPDPYLVTEIDDIVEDDSDGEQFPSARPVELDIDQWLMNRVVAAAHLTGRSVDITAAETVEALHPLL